MIKAVIDVGSNSVLLLVARNTANGWVVLTEETAVTALGEGTKTTGLLCEASMAQTLDALGRFFHIARELGAEHIVAGVTMAARIAKNTPDFLERARLQNTPVVVVSGEEEAQLGFLAVAEDPLFSECRRVSIIDVGGHSTELATADRLDGSWKVGFRNSFAVGTLGLRETLLKGESPSSLDQLRASAAIDDLIGLIYRPNEAGIAVALGATGTNLVTIRDRILEWDPTVVHGKVLSYEEVSRASGWMFGLTDAERAAIPGIEPGRERTIHIGALLLERFMNALKVDQCSVSVRGWRYAVLEHGLAGDIHE